MLQSITEIIEKLKVGNLSTESLHLLAAEALAVTLDQKMVKAGALGYLTKSLEDALALFPEDFPLDDIRYRLAHLYLREHLWEKAAFQLSLLSDKTYYGTEARIYGALCHVKMGNKDLEISRIAAQLKNSESIKYWRTKNVQEQLYNLLEMLVYAAELQHESLGDYYDKGYTIADLKIKTQSHSLGLPIAQFRLERLLPYYKEQNALIIDMTRLKKLGEFETRSLSSSVRKFAMVLIERYPSRVSRENLEEELRDIWTGRNATLTEWKNALCSSLNNSKAVELFDTGRGETTKYRLNHPFLLIRSRKTSNYAASDSSVPPSPRRSTRRM